MKPISTYVHGILDYTVSSILFFAPNIFGFADLGGPAVWLPRALGAGAVLYSLFTRYEWSLAKIIPFKIHLGIDFLSGLLLAASPWLFGFANQPEHVWLPHVAGGLLEMGVVALSQTQPKLTLAQARA